MVRRVATTVVAVAAVPRAVVPGPRVTLACGLRVKTAVAREAGVVAATAAAGVVVGVAARVAAKAAVRAVRPVPDPVLEAVSHGFSKASASADAFFLDARPVLGSNCPCSFASSHGRSHRQRR
jgi:hypothetical protein